MNHELDERVCGRCGQLNKGFDAIGRKCAYCHKFYSGAAAAGDLQKSASDLNKRFQGHLEVMQKVNEFTPSEIQRWPVALKRQVTDQMKAAVEEAATVLADDRGAMLKFAGAATGILALLTSESDGSVLSMVKAAQQRASVPLFGKGVTSDEPESDCLKKVKEAQRNPSSRIDPRELATR